MNKWTKIGLAATTTVAACMEWILLPQDSIASQPVNNSFQGGLRYQLAVPALRRSVCGVTFLEPPPVPALDVAVPRATPVEVRFSSVSDVAVTGAVHPEVTSNDVPSSAIVKLSLLTGQYDSGVCAICYDSPQLIKSWPPCGHVFCLKCLYHWCEIVLKDGVDWRCPFCNQLFGAFLQENGRRCIRVVTKKRGKIRFGFFNHLSLDHFMVMGYLIVLPTCALSIYVGIYGKF